MKRYVFTNSDNRICTTTESKEYTSDEYFEFDFPDDFDFFKQNDYLIKDGELVYDPAPIPDEVKEFEEEKQRDAQLKIATTMFVNESAPSLTDEQALSIPLLFYEWRKDTDYVKDHIVRYEGELYRIGQNHTSQEQWKPGDEGTTALYSHIKITEEGYEVWKAWDGVSGIYSEGQIVEDPNDGQLYKSKIPNNVWGPPSEQPTYWDLYKEDE